MELPWKKPWLVLLAATVLVQVFGSSGCLMEEKRALLDFKATHSNESLLPSWVDSPKSNCCQWKSVTCDSSSHHVIDLDLSGLSRNREISEIETCRLFSPLNWSLFLSFKELRSLDMSRNCLDGFLWKGDYRSKSILKKLETLYLGHNSFNESTVEFLNTLPSIKTLRLDYNRIGGPFPMKELSLLRNLERLGLAGNNLIGSLATQDYGRNLTLKKLEALDLGYSSLNESTMEFLSSALPSLKILSLFETDIGGLSPIKGLCKMKQLEVLALSDNIFTGNPGTCIGNLTSLRTLYLLFNSSSGIIPTSSIVHLRSLERLSLYFNEFEGSFSLSILSNHSNLKELKIQAYSEAFHAETENPPWTASFQLEYLNISNCKVNLLTKKIPTFLLNQSAFRAIDLSGNNLVGKFPSWLLLNNPKLESLNLGSNSFTGPFKLPLDLNYPMDQLMDLDLAANRVQGELPNNIGVFLPHLEYLDLSTNLFLGNIPASIGDMSSLEYLYLPRNNFSGKVPEPILNGCTSLRVFMMDNNQLNGTLPSGIETLKLSVLTASRNNFEGVIPRKLCQLKLEMLDLSHNKFYGTLPSCFKMLKFVFMHGNNLSGTITEALINNSFMEAIDLSDNKITGTIPEGIYGLENLGFLSLAGNQLQGQLSSQICKLQNIQILDLSRNNLTGSIPSCFNNLSFLGNPSLYKVFIYRRDYTIAYDLRELQFRTKGSSLSYSGEMLGRMSGLDLSSNQLTGQIPHQIGYLHALHALNLSHNHLNGPIPESFKNLESIESLDLSINNLSGQIPFHLQDLHFLSVFNVSYNNLSGRAPIGGQFGTFDESSYKGNPYLSWSNSNRGIATPPPPPAPTPLNDGKKNDSAIDFTSFCWSFVGSYVIVLIALVTILWINPHWRRVWFYFVGRCLHKCLGQFLDNEFY